MLSAMFSLSMAQSELTYVHVDETAEPLNLAQVIDRIAYAPEAISNGIEGQVVFRILVNKEGEYRKHWVLKSDHPALAGLAASELRKLKFRPAMIDGEPTISWVNLPVRFEIRPGFASR